MTDTPGAESPPERHYIQFDLDKSDEVLDEQIMNWLVEILGPPSDEDPEHE